MRFRPCYFEPTLNRGEGSLSNDEVSAVSAYILSEAKIIPGDTVLGPGNLANVRMLNRDGFVADHRPDKFKPVAQTGQLR